MSEDKKQPDSQDEIGEADASVIAEIVARYCLLCSAAEILRRVKEVLAPRPPPAES